ncbi:MAG: class I SAM-dependent methyltransferase [Candidatus Cloacimonetes bacterium]|nr:class I SAM-dependent methyltransferase [Candidatus Cloacimonadota bacterium]
MFTKSAKFYDALYHFLDYEMASQKITTIVFNRNPNALSLLDVACGTGKHLEFLKNHYLLVEGLDINQELLDIAEIRLPDVKFSVGDMIDFKLSKSFDVVTCLFSSIAYVKSLSNMRKAISKMSAHLNSGGILLVEPWISPEQYWERKIIANFVDQPDLKISWMYTHEVDGAVSIFNINYLVGTPEGVTYFTEKHEMGMFTRTEYEQAFLDAGLTVEYDPVGLFMRGLYIGVKKA